MKLIVKTLAGKQLPIEVDADWSVKAVKDQIEKDHQLESDKLKLIAYGKVLDSDDKKVSEFNLKEGDFIVAMVQKAKPKPAAKPADVPKVEAPKPDAKEDPKEEKKDDKPAQNNASATQAQTQPAANNNA